jgi:DNA uptake protein ComE-like DNA-binding protein
MKTFLAGLGVGVGLGVLFAPESSEATRRKVRERLTGLVDNLRRQMDKAKDVVDKTVAGYHERSSAESGDSQTTFSPKKDQARERRSFASSDPINTLTREELLNVGGIGPVLADKIISGRPYPSRQELVQRGILPQGTFEELDRELSHREKRSA